MAMTAAQREAARKKARAYAKKGGQRGMAAKDMPLGWAVKKKKPAPSGTSSKGNTGGGRGRVTTKPKPAPSGTSSTGNTGGGRGRVTTKPKPATGNSVRNTRRRSSGSTAASRRDAALKAAHTISQKVAEVKGSRLGRANRRLDAAMGLSSTGKPRKNK